jgi:hypothetical protein
MRFNRMALVCAAALTAGAHGQGAVQWRVEDGGNGHWYRLSSDVCGWEEARNRASNQGGHLASITSEAENAFIVALGVGRSWIGAFQEPGACEPGCFSWVTGEPWQYQRWMGGQPDGFAGSENYVEIRANSYWNDLNAGWQFSYIVEWSADCNGDGVVDLGQILAGEFVDANGNGVPDCCEGALGCCPGDISRNGTVNGTDLAAVLAAWGSDGQTKFDCDIDDSGVVDGSDLAFVLAGWGACP